MHTICTVSVPTKVTLLGEHTVVYGEPAIVAALDERLRITMRPRQDSKLVIRGYGLSISNTAIETSIIDHEYVVSIPKDVISKLFSYVITALRVFREQFSVPKTGLEIDIRSRLPPGVGLGTSASISVGCIASCAVLHGISLDERTLARMGHRVELEVQGAASPMDTAAVTYGGLLYVEPRSNTIEKLKYRDLEIVVGYLPKRYTTAELVRKVRNLKNRHPSVIEKLIAISGDIVRKAREAIDNLDIERFGELMNIFHGILESLGVVDDSVNTIVHALRRAGALGAKMSGAGGGGAFVALAKSSEHAHVLRSIAMSMGAKVLEKGITYRGVIVEEIK